MSALSINNHNTGKTGRRVSPKLLAMGAAAVLGGGGAAAAGVAITAGGNQSSELSPPPLTVQPSRDTPVNQWPITRVVVQEGDGPYQLTQRVDPELVAGAQSDASLRDKVMDEVKRDNGPLHPGQVAAVRDLNPGQPASSGGALPKPPAPIN